MTFVLRLLHPGDEATEVNEHFFRCGCCLMGELAELEEEEEKEKEEERIDEGLLNQKDLPSKKRAANEDEVEAVLSSKSEKKKKKKISTKKRASEGPVEWDLTMVRVV